MSTTDLFSRKLYNDGEGIETSDFNEMSSMILARMTDQFFERRCPAIALGNDLGSALLDPDVPGELGDRAIGQVLGNSLAFTSVAGEAMIYPASNTTVKITAGTVFQKSAAADGSAPTLKPYTIKANDLTFSVQAGHATLPRYDIIQIKIDEIDDTSLSRDFEDATTRIKTSTTFNTRHRYQLTAQYKQGTANASPTHTLPDAGFVALAAIRVPAAWTSGLNAGDDVALNGSSAIPMQVSIPLGIRSYVISPEQFFYNGSTNWALDSSGRAAASGSASGLIIPGPSCNLGRIVGVSLEGSFVTSGQCLIGRLNWTVLGRGFSQAADLSNVMLSPGSSTLGFAVLAALAGGTAPFSSTQFAGDPVWANGSRVASLRDLQVAGTTTMPVSTLNSTSRVALKIAAGNASVVGPARFWVAG